MSSTEHTVLRPATAEDATAVADLHLAARRAAVPAMPAPVHDDDDVRSWMAGRLRAGDEVWVAEAEGVGLAGYLRMTPEWLDDLYVSPRLTGQGIGSALLDLAKSLQPSGFALWVFETNTGARRFYRRHGLVELEHTDGSTNEERAPDLRMAWPGLTRVGALSGFPRLRALPMADQETTAAALPVRGAGRLRMAHSATPRLITQAAPISSARPSSLGGPAIISPAASVSTCVPAPSPIAYARAIQARCRWTSPRRIVVKPNRMDPTMADPNTSRKAYSSTPSPSGQG